MTGKSSHFLIRYNLLLPSWFLYRKGLGSCDALLTFSYQQQVALSRSMEGRLIQLDFSSAFDRISYRNLLYKLRSIGIGVQFLPIVSEFLSERRQHVRDG